MHNLRYCSLFLSVVAVAVLAGPALAQDGGSSSCKKPRMLIVLDRSSSMVTGKVGSVTKWDEAKTALKYLLTNYEKSIDFGLLVFPDPSQCGWGKVRVGIGPQNATAIMNQLSTAPPSSGNWTPMYQSLDVAAGVQNLQNKAYSNNVLLITDGWQWCSPYDSKTRFLPVSSAAKVKGKGMTLYVVGFGDGVDALTLNKMADTAGTKVSTSCNVAQTDPKKTDQCYYKAGNAAALSTAFKSIAVGLTKETCDNVDNDCNGKVDDGLSRACSTKCGTGTETCTAGTWGNCTAQQPSKEICDGKDNNCDGVVDEGCSCKEGATRACGLSKGECKPGTQTCKGGIWSSCTGATYPATEVCDGKDNNCDGQTDEKLTRSCKTACGTGTETCVNGSYQNCTAPAATKEICDGKDNDCDGTVDGPTVVCENGGTCVNGICKLTVTDMGTSSTDMTYLPPGMDDGTADCNCRTTSTPPAGSLAWMLVVGLLLVARRRS